MFIVAVAIFAVGVIVAITVPVVQKSTRRAQAAEVVAELRSFAEAFRAQERQRGTWPPAAHAVGQVPPGMTTVLGPEWSAITPIGGGYLWAPDALQRGQRYRATIILASLPRAPLLPDPRLLQEIDRQIDDGDLRTGTFQLGYRDQPFLVIEP